MSVLYCKYIPCSGVMLHHHNAFASDIPECTPLIGKELLNLSIVLVFEE